MRKNTENLHPIVQFETLSKCLGNLMFDQQVIDPVQHAAMLDRIMTQMDRLLNEMNPDEPAQRETSFKDACSIVAKRIHHIMQARSLGELAITFKHGFRGDWVIDKTKLALTLQTTQDGDEKKEKYFSFDDVDLNALLVQAEAQLLYDDPSVPNYHEQLMRAKPSEQARLVKEYVPFSKRLTRKEQIQLLTTDVSAWNVWCGNLMDSPKLRKVDLRGHNLQGAVLYKADLFSADLRGTNLHGADLNKANMLDAVYNDATIFPEGFDPQSSGMLHEDDVKTA